MTKNLLFAAPLLVAAALAVGCGDSGGSYGDTSAPAAKAAKTSEPVAEATTAPTTAPADASASLPTEAPETTIKETKRPAAVSEKTEVKMAGSVFAPASVDIRVGDTVTFVNDDAIAHTATSDAFDSGTMDPGASFEFTAKEAGTISYLCSFHPGMTGTINVS